MKEIFERVSIRKFQEKEIPREALLNVLRAAMAAPSAGNQQPWEFYIVTDRERIEALAASTPYSGCAKGAPAVIAAAYREALWAPAYAQIDMSIAVENLWLACGEEGLGGVWLGIAPIEERMRTVEEILALPQGQRAFALFPIGYPAETKAQQDRFDLSRIHFL